MLLQSGQELVVCNEALTTGPKPMSAQPAKGLLTTICYLHFWLTPSFSRDTEKYLQSNLNSPEHLLELRELKGQSSESGNKVLVLRDPLSPSLPLPGHGVKETLTIPLQNLGDRHW